MSHVLLQEKVWSLGSPPKLPSIGEEFTNECGKDEADYLEAAGQALDGPWRREAAVGHCSKLRKVSLRRLPSRHQEAFLNLREKTSFIPARSNACIGGNKMKTLVSVLALSLMVGFSAPAFAGATPKTQAECTKAGMHWDSSAKKCSKGM
jgi:hypothetical protein